MSLINYIDRGDVVVAGGSLAACHLAASLAGRGLKVILVCRGTSLAPEITGTLRVWLDPREADEAPEPFAKIFRETRRSSPADGATPLFHLGKLTEALEDMLLGAGVRLYYHADPVGLAHRDGSCRGVLVGGKFGLGVLTAPTVVETTPLATLARLAGGRFEPRQQPAQGIPISLVVQHMGDAVPPIGAIKIQVVSKHGPFVEYAGFSSANPLDPFFAARVSVDSRMLLVSAGQGLPESPLRCADVPSVAPLIAMKGGSKGSIASGGLAGVLVVGRASSIDDARAAELARSPVHEVLHAAEHLDAIGSIARDRAAGFEDGGPDQIRVRPPGDERRGTGTASLRTMDPQYAEPEVSAREAAMEDVPEACASQLVVCGGGTCGVAAAVEGARSGVSTVCLEANADLGGIHTVGGVNHYWLGRWPRHMEEHYLELKRLTVGRNLPWSVAQLIVAREAGVEVLPSTSAAGVWVEGKRVRGVAIATATGLAMARSDLLIDSTGDGDLAAWAGAGYTYGSERDEITLWYSFGKFRSDRREVSRHYLSVVDQRSLRDTTRAIMTARRLPGIFGEGEYPQFALATRESRHITGRSRLGYADMLQGKRFADVVVAFRSNVDIKGMSSSDEAMAGYVERDFLRAWACQIPFGSLVPERLDNVLVVGKAYSASHDAISMARMQSDVTDLGAAAGVAAGLAVKDGGSFGDLDVMKLQKTLLSRGLLVPADLPGAQPWAETITAEHLECLVDRALTGPMELDDQMALVSGGERVIPFLERVVDKPEGGLYMLAIARYLAYLRQRRGTRYLLAEVQKAIDAPELPGLWARKEMMAPNHGWLPEPVYYVNALALAGEREVIPLLARLAGRIKTDTPPVDFRFSYVHSISYALERLADPAGVPILKDLLSRPPLHGRHQPRGGDPRASSDYVGERCAYLEYCLARALARTGDPEGYRILIAYLGDQRMYLARSAKAELEEVTGQSLGFDPGAWCRWVEGRRGKLAPAPFRRHID